MTWERTYSDGQLTHAVAAVRSWRGVLRALGLSGTSAQAIRSVRTHADRLGLDYTHFRGVRTWTEHELREAVAGSTSWTEVGERLGGRDDRSLALLKGHTLRLRLDTEHLSDLPEDGNAAEAPRPDVKNLARAGSLLAASWFTLTGHDVSWPLEPCRYDLLVMDGAKLSRVQVKTTTVRIGESWKVYLTSSHRGRRTYDPNEIDAFFIVDGDLGFYLIPVAEVGGLQAIHLAAYARFRLARLDDSSPGSVRLSSA